MPVLYGELLPSFGIKTCCVRSWHIMLWISYSTQSSIYVLLCYINWCTLKHNSNLIMFKFMQTWLELIMFQTKIIFFSVNHAQRLVVDGFSVLIRWPKQLAPIWVPKCIFNVYNPNSMNSLIDKILCIIIHKIRIIYTWNVHIGTHRSQLLGPCTWIHILLTFLF